MPTRFCVKKIGKPSSIRIAKETKKKIGENNTNRKRAKSLDNI